MFTRLDRINQFVKNVDQSLFAVNNGGMIQILRKTDKIDAVDYEGPAPTLSTYILSLTDDWTPRGNPVDWGLDPLWFKLQQMDSNRNPNMFREMRERREAEERDKERQSYNNIRAAALDFRKPLAKATNEINTANLR